MNANWTKCVVAALCTWQGTTVCAQDVILSWNEALIQATRNDPLNGPGYISRAGAMMHTAMYNAVNDGSHESYEGFNYAAPANTSRKAAAAVAAHGVLTSVLPASQHNALHAQLNWQLSQIADPVARANGINMGVASANHMLQLRAQDGHNSTQPYTFGTNPGDWVMTQPGDPIHSHWGNVAPFTLASGSQFRPNRLTNYGTMENFLASDEWATNLNEVKALGSVNSWTPADDEYQMAFFWANDRDGTAKPPGHMNMITQTFAEREFAGLDEDTRMQQQARMFALVNLAMADAGIAAWDSKYNTDFDLWRPTTAVQNAHLDGRLDTEADPNWEPLNHIDPDGDGPMTADPFSPQFPAWVSGHATFSAAHASILEAFFGSDTFDPILLGTDDPYVLGLEREYSSFSQMAWENALSRLYLGVHYRIDAIDGNALGYDVARWTFANYLRPVPAPAGSVVLAMGMLVCARRRRC